MEDLRLKINDYFNLILRDALRYPEKFQIEIHKDRIILYPNQPSSLLGLLIRDKPLKNNLLKIVGNFIEKNVSDAYDVSLNTDGTNIIIKWLTEEVLRPKLDPRVEIGSYANIASNLDIESLNKMCRSNPNSKSYAVIQTSGCN